MSNINLASPPGILQSLVNVPFSTLSLKPFTNSVFLTNDRPFFIAVKSGFEVDIAHLQEFHDCNLHCSISGWDRSLIPMIVPTDRTIDIPVRHNGKIVIIKISSRGFHQYNQEYNTFEMYCSHTTYSRSLLLEIRQLVLEMVIGKLDLSLSSYRGERIIDLARLMKP